MRIVPITELFEVSDGAPIEGVKGTLKALYERKSGVTKKKEWSFQNAVLTDGANEIKVKLVSRPELDGSFKGKQVHILSHFGDRGMSGVKAKDDTYEKNGEKVTERILWVTGSAAITESTPGNDVKTPSSGKNAGNPTKQAATPPQNKPAPATKAPVKDSFGPSDVNGARKRFLQSANLHILALDAAEYVAAQYEAKHPGRKMTLEDIRCIASGMCIDQQKIGTLNMMPTSPLPTAPAAKDNKPK